MKIIDLKNNNNFLKQYIDLRNEHKNLLLSLPVTLAETKKWLKTTDIEVRGIVQNDILTGVVILYLEKNGEIAVFVRYPNRGLGTKLLSVIEKVAEQKGLFFVWAWISKDNLVSRHVFEKDGFIKSESGKKRYNNRYIEGNKFVKELQK